MRRTQSKDLFSEAPEGSPGAEPVAVPPRPRVAAAKVLRAYSAHILLGLALALAVAGGIAWLAMKPSPKRIEVVIPTPAPVVVQVTGAVASPGVYELPPGSRVRDALDAAGGVLPGAATDSINLAAKLDDGTRLEVPAAVQAASSPGQGESNAATGTTATGTGAPAPGRIDLNTASLQQLMALPGIGETLAAAIIEYRSRNGPVRRVDDLLAVQHIGPKTIEAIRPFVVQQ